MIFNADELSPAFNLGPVVYTSNTLLYQMFGFKGPLWMTQTCNDGSGCPFVQGNTGGASRSQTNTRLWSSYAKPGESLEAFVAMMEEEAMSWHAEMGGQRPWKVSDVSDLYMVFNDADPWTGPGAIQHFPADRNLIYDVSPGGVSHCVYNPPGAQEWIREWAKVQ